MSEENDWNHRSQMERHDSEKTRSITQEVRDRRHGPVGTFIPSSDSSREEDANEYDDPADEWAAKFPDSWTDS